MEGASLADDLMALRRAAGQGDWNLCRGATEALLLRLPMSRAVELARQHVARRLPIFERHQPGIRWPREFVESIPAAGFSVYARTWPVEDEFPGPGANNFINAVRSLWEASQLRGDARRCAEALVNAFSGSIMGEKLEHWGARHPDAWARWYQLASSGSDDGSRFDILASSSRDPEAVAVQRAAWLEVADRLEAALQSA
jgi:hypothetical protein